MKKIALQNKMRMFIIFLIKQRETTQEIKKVKLKYRKKKTEFGKIDAIYVTNKKRKINLINEMMSYY